MVPKENQYNMVDDKVGPLDTLFTSSNPKPPPATTGTKARASNIVINATT